MRIAECLFFLAVLFATKVPVLAQESFNPLRGPYMGQRASGAPAIFLPGKISTGSNEGCSLFFSGARSFLWRTSSDGSNLLLLLEDKDGRWQPPRQVHIFDDHAGVWDFTLAPDGDWIYFTSDKESSKAARNNLWRVRLESGDFLKPEMLGLTVNSDWFDGYPSITREGDLYFFRRNPEELADCDLYVSYSENDRCKAAVRLGASVNTTSLEYDPFIAADGSYLIFSSDRPGGYGEGDLYISFLMEGKQWSEPVNLGPEINSAAEESRPSVTLDGQYFFFTSTRINEPTLPPGTPPARSMPGSGSRDIYWVTTDFVENLKARKAQ
jgi:Tol biopolymer transport system component